MNKKSILDQLINQVKQEMTKNKEAFESSHNYATDTEFKSEGKYDTRSIEAGQLAGAQKARLNELELELNMLEEVNITALKKDAQVAIGACVEIEHQGQTRLYFISPTAGGSLIKVDDEVVLIISVFSPLGAEVLGLKAGDEFEVETPKETRLYKVQHIF